MNTNQKKKLHLHFCREILQDELYKQSAYITSSFSPPTGNQGEDRSLAWVLSSDEAPLSVLLLQEAYNKLYSLMAGYIVGASVLNPESDGFEFILEMPETLPISQEEIIAFCIRQSMIYYALYRWYAQKNIEISAHFLSLYQTATDDLRGHIHRRTVPSRRSQHPY